ncbi:MAG: tyrosine-type recombinase/integrase [Mycobacterium sp.]|nr:tyrosine-type recombinase/integrase [Mycobacterium sp.]
MTSTPARRHLTAVDTPTVSARQQMIERFRLRYEIRRSARTAEVYAWAADRLDQWLTAVGDRREFTDLDTETIEDFLADFAHGRHGFTAHSASYTNQIYRSLRVFFGWLAERYDTPNPIRRVEAPRLGERRIENKVLTDDQLADVLATVAHNHRDLAAIRDHAMLRLLLTGVRREELVGLTLDDVELRERAIRVRGKGDAAGGRTRYVGFGKEAALALMDYLDARAKHPLAHRKDLWLGRRGVITGRGFHSIVRKRGEQAGIPGLHPHMFRHTAAHRWLEAGGSEGDLMENMGWKTREMTDLYARSTRAERARKAWQDLGLDDRI